MGRFYDEEKSRFKYLILLSSFFDHLIIYGIAYGAGVFQVNRKCNCYNNMKTYINVIIR